ncbi:MAG TPA: hypothetical protein VFB93_26265 [Burkholderiales bacterium]|jgi:hypothetical protein|nr:hypothetical protein [Burkholderiales bacterium]
MTGWLIPALKAVLPHVGTIISAAGPVFTKKSSPHAPNQAALLQQQVAELQSAVSKNAEHIRELAAQLQATVAAIEQAAVTAEARFRRLTALCVASLGLSAFALGVALLVARI